MTDSYIQINRANSAQRIQEDIETLARPPYSSMTECVRRYAYTPEYLNTLEYFARMLRALQFNVWFDGVGNMIARNEPDGIAACGVGSHCDAVRNGGKYDGVLGVAIAVELCRLNDELQLGLPLEVLVFVEEEGAGFGQTLLGSRVMSGRLGEEDLRERICALDDGRPFWEHAELAGYSPGEWRASRRALDNLICWIECHIEQGRVLEDGGYRLGVVTDIAGYHHGDLTFYGRADHAGATPMTLRNDALAAASEVVTAVEELAARQPVLAVGTVGEIEVEPNVLNVVPAKVRMSLDIRSADNAAVAGLRAQIVQSAEVSGKHRGVDVVHSERQSILATRMNPVVVAALAAGGEGCGDRYVRIVSGAAHDTMCLADHVPSGMLFVPCDGGVSHSPAERADPADAALAAEVVLNSIRTLVAGANPDCRGDLR